MKTTRRVTEEDVEAWARMRAALLREYEGPGAIPASELQASVSAWLRERLASPAFGAFVAVAEGVPVASGGISIYDVPPGPALFSREAYVMSMYTLPEHRGRGFARAVLESMLDFARRAGSVGRVWLRASDMGRPIYLRSGFVARDRYLDLPLAP